jgi:serine/threonine protein kinase
MKSRLGSVRPAGGLDRVNRAVQMLEDEWQRHGEVQFGHFWTEARGQSTVDSENAVALLAELVKADLRCRFENGQTPAVAEYLDQFPELEAEKSHVLSLVYEEYCLNEEHGNAPDVESFCNRYPDWKSSLVSQLQYHRLFSTAAGRRPSLPPFPEAGQDFEEFRLQSLLGSGGVSRVFLARDLSLGGKEVVLKVTLDRGQEPKVQGPLDHPHIVPVNSVVYQTDGELCGMSMPYRPGLSLDKLIGFIDPAGRPRKAISLWRELQLGTRYSANPPGPRKPSADSPDDELPSAPRGDGWEGFPVRGSYAQGAAWIVMIVARALHYAHRKQTFHRDVKPGNILLTLHNGPQLLDFNLAESPHSADHAQAALHGGTLPYMAPEQIEAFINPDLWEKVGAQADIYSLGLVLRELLTGQKPELPDPAVAPARALRAVLDHRPFLDAAVRRFNPAIPHALEAIVAKCLALAPANRYPDADELDKDLDRFLKHEPLKQVVNPSRRERLSNWLTRHRRMVVAASCLFVVAAAYPVIEALKPRPIQTTRAFVSAVRRFDRGESATEAVTRFRSFEAIDPRSPLLNSYLGFALKAAQKPDDAKQFDEADQYMRTALAAPDVEATTVPWIKDHLKFDTYLVDFAESRIRRADDFATKYDVGDPRADLERDKHLKSSEYQLAMDALLLAAKLNPGSLKTQRLLAKTEQHFERYAAALERLSRIIGRFSPGIENDMLFQSHELRGWVARRWAEKDHDLSKADSASLARLVAARKDYDYCALYLKNRKFGEKQALIKYYVIQHRLRATVALADVELDLSSWEEATKHLDEGEESLRGLSKYIESNRLEVAKTTYLEQRIKDGRSRLQHRSESKVLSTRHPSTDQASRLAPGRGN